MTKRILFSVYGYGLGHATRCHAIINLLKKRRVSMRLTASDNAYDYFKSKGYTPKRIRSVAIGSTNTSFSWLNTLFANIDLPFNLINDYYAFKKICSNYSPNVVVSDTEPISLVYASVNRVPSVFISNILPILSEYDKLPVKVKNPKTDSQLAVITALVNNVLKNCRRVISPTFSEPDPNNKVDNVGLIIRSKPEELPKDSALKKKIKSSDYCLVSFGGAKITSDYYNTMLPVLKKIKKRFIVSTNGAVDKITTVKNLVLFPFINNYLEYLKLSDSVICLSGHSTISECLAYKKPVFTIPVQNHLEQLTNASIIKRRGFGESFFISNSIKPESIQKRINEFIKMSDDYKTNIDRAALNIDGQTAAAKSILSVRS